MAEAYMVMNDLRILRRKPDEEVAMDLRTFTEQCLNINDFGPPLDDREPDPMGNRTRRFLLRVFDMAREFPYEGPPWRWRISDDMAMRCEQGHQHHPRVMLGIHVIVDEHLPPNSIVLDPRPGAKPREVLDDHGNAVPDGMLPIGR